jgi:hypothetical protein
VQVGPHGLSTQEKKRSPCEQQVPDEAGGGDSKQVAMQVHSAGGEQLEPLQPISLAQLDSQFSRSFVQVVPMFDEQSESCLSMHAVQLALFSSMELAYCTQSAWKFGGTVQLLGGGASHEPSALHVFPFGQQFVPLQQKLSLPQHISPLIPHVAPPLQTGLASAVAGQQLSLQHWPGGQQKRVPLPHCTSPSPHVTGGEPPHSLSPVQVLPDGQHVLPQQTPP